MKYQKHNNRLGYDAEWPKKICGRRVFTDSTISVRKIRNCSIEITSIEQTDLLV
jgi:hypothetical protein